MGIISDIIGPILNIVNKEIPDPALQAQIKMQMLQLDQSEEFKQIDAQLATSAQQTDTNKAEATNANIFVSGWRPFIGWVCGGGLAYQYLAEPMLSWFAAIVHWPLPPSLDVQTLITLLGGMLGFGAMRTVEKVKGINNGH